MELVKIINTLDSHNPLVSFLVIVALSIILARVTYWLMGTHLTILTRRTQSDLDDKIIENLKSPLYYTIIIVGFWFGLDRYVVDLVNPEYSDELMRLAIILLIVVSTVSVARILNTLIERVAKKVTKKAKSTLDEEAIPFVLKIFDIVIYLIAFMIILDQLGIPITPLVASLGIFGVALGFGAKDIVSNLLAGFLILFDRPFMRGERIEIGGISGDVVDIGLRSTRLKTEDNKLVVIPNTSIITENVTNYAQPNPHIKLMIDYGVAYGSDVDRVKETILDVANKSKNVLKEPKPEVYFMEFGESSLNFKLVCWMANFRSFPVKDELNTKINDRFKKEGIGIPFPTRTIHLEKD